MGGAKVLLAEELREYKRVRFKNKNNYIDNKKVPR